ncbi:relaxase/mobilization nuclease domain-containing protein [Sphingomonas mollis]|uniref:Relaxase/mobilization nuclease domain-containing protein n=1 Tax=Sphingomonas mollis TaxID=2795726 RepID=A0ABS0XU85_9SPHN|nr:relaxase/mobilization nuclease domain-containing protein [Sphingomonas sp. BT553]MBJ6123609.1 relaxase/mobilization nuclease domain-containing protein [Sphingomonas sp. BT553]
MSSAQAAARARLDRLSSKVPEVMVKVTGRKHVGGAASAHLAYIGRHGQLEIETRDGDLIDTKAAMIALGEEWDSDADSARGQRVAAVALVFSMPEGTPPSVVKDAARAVAQQTFGEIHDFVMALHVDTGRPHVHLTVAAAGENGQRFNPRKDDLARMRESFAQELRSRGVKAEATPRRARGQMRSGQAMSLYKQRVAHQLGERPLPNADAAVLNEVRSVIVGTKSFHHTPDEIAGGRNWRHARAVYTRAADRLARSDEAEDRTLAAKVHGFVAAFPTPDTYRMAVGKSAIEKLKRAPDPPRRRDGPDRSSHR